MIGPLTAKTIILAFALLALTVLYIFLLVRLYRFLQVKIGRNHEVKLANRGNVSSVYQLSIHSPEYPLIFKMSYKGIPLVESIPTPPTTESIVSVSPAKEEQKRSATKKDRKGGFKVDMSRADQAGQTVAEKAGAAASFLGILGSLIPGALGNKLRSQGTAARNIQTKTKKTTQAPLSAKRKVDALTGQGVPSSRHEKIRPDFEGNIHQETAEQAAIESTSDSKKAWFSRKTSPGSYLVQTKEVKPGETLSLTLNITPYRKRQAGVSYLYTIESQQIPLDQETLTIKPVLTCGTVHFKLYPLWRYWLPPVICGLVVVSTFLSLYYYLVIL